MNTARPKYHRLMTLARLRMLRTLAPNRVDAWNVRLSWPAPDSVAGGAQAYYQVQVATSRAAFADTRPLAWDSGRVRGTQPSAPVPPFALLDATVYFWRARTWDGAGRESAWSAVQCIVTSGGPALAVRAAAGLAGLGGYAPMPGGRAS